MFSYISVMLFTLSFIGLLALTTKWSFNIIV
jgi:hypothetical protein